METLAVLSTEALLVVGYVLVADVRIEDPTVLVYPFVWINAAVWAVLRTAPASTCARRRAVAMTVAGGYFVVLAVFGGLVAVGVPVSSGVDVYWGLPPGYGPRVILGLDPVRVILEPYKLVGYLALSYLVYAAVLDAAGVAFRGIVGVFACVSCTWPILGTLLANLFGSTSVAVAVATNQPYGVSTAVFLTAVGLLVWRPFQ